MNRRGFLGLLGAVAAGVALDPERLLWVPGKKLISIPRRILDLQRVGVDFEMREPHWRMPEFFYERHISPSLDAIEKYIRKRYRVASFERLELPEPGFVELAHYDATRSNMPTRVIVAYDAHRDDPCLVARVDCAFRGELK